jgi:hypothetical protein
MACFAGHCFSVFPARAGGRIAIRRMALDPEGAREGHGVVDGAVFALLGLLAFTFSGAATRFEAGGT